MEVDADEEEGGSVGVEVADKSAELYVSAYVGDRGKGQAGVCCVMHS